MESEKWSKNPQESNREIYEPRILRGHMHKSTKYSLGCLAVVIILLCSFMLRCALLPEHITAWRYNITIPISNEKNEKWLLVFFPFIGEKRNTPFRINVPPLEQQFMVDNECLYRQYVIITERWKSESVDLHFHSRLPYDKFFLLVLGWKIDPGIQSLDAKDLATYFETEPDYQEFFFSPTYTGNPELNDYKAFAHIDLSG